MKAIVCTKYGPQDVLQLKVVITVAFIAFLGGNTSNLWLLIKTTILIISMVTSYILADKMDKKELDTQQRT